MGGYPVPAARHRCEETVRKSRFIATVAHADSPEEARAFIEAVRNEFRGASHNCWAFQAGPPGSAAAVGMSDDGEPHGTAGRPMLNVLSGSGIGEIAVVVTRFYGGVKLGTGGLVRAYAGAVKSALEVLPLKEKRTMAQCRLALAYRHADPVRSLAASLGGGILEEAYAEGVTFLIELPEDAVEGFHRKAADLTGGGVRILP